MTQTNVDKPEEDRTKDNEWRRLVLESKIV